MVTYLPEGKAVGVKYLASIETELSYLILSLESVRREVLIRSAQANGYSLAMQQWVFHFRKCRVQDRGQVQGGRGEKRKL